MGPYYRDVGRVECAPLVRSDNSGSDEGVGADRNSGEHARIARVAGRGHLKGFDLALAGQGDRRPRGAERELIQGAIAGTESGPSR